MCFGRTRTSMSTFANHQSLRLRVTFPSEICKGHVPQRMSSLICTARNFSATRSSKNSSWGSAKNALNKRQCLKKNGKSSCYINKAAKIQFTKQLRSSSKFTSFSSRLACTPGFHSKGLSSVLDLTWCQTQNHQNSDTLTPLIFFISFAFEEHPKPLQGVHEKIIVFCVFPMLFLRVLCY